MQGERMMQSKRTRGRKGTTGSTQGPAFDARPCRAGLGSTGLCTGKRSCSPRHPLVSSTQAQEARLPAATPPHLTHTSAPLCTDPSAHISSPPCAHPLHGGFTPRQRRPLVLDVGGQKVAPHFLLALAHVLCKEGTGSNAQAWRVGRKAGASGIKWPRTSSWRLPTCAAGRGTEAGRSLQQQDAVCSSGCGCAAVRSRRAAPQPVRACSRQACSRNLHGSTHFSKPPEHAKCNGDSRTRHLGPVAEAVDFDALQQQQLLVRLGGRQGGERGNMAGVGTTSCSRR